MARKAKAAVKFGIELYLYLFIARLLCWVVEGGAYLAGTWWGVVGLVVIGLLALLAVLVLSKNLVFTVGAAIIEVLAYFVCILAGGLATGLGWFIGWGAFSVLGIIVVLATGAALGYTEKVKPWLLDFLWTLAPEAKQKSESTGAGTKAEA